MMPQLEDFFSSQFPGIELFEGCGEGVIVICRETSVVGLCSAFFAIDPANPFSTNLFEI